MDVNTGELTFIRCSFHNNFGAQIYCEYADITDNIFFHDCSIKAESSRYQDQIILATENGVMENSYIDVGAHNFDVTWLDPPSPKQNTTVRIVRYIQKGQDWLVQVLQHMY